MRADGQRQGGEPGGGFVFMFVSLVPIQHLANAVSVAQSCLTLRHPTDHSPPGSSVHGISQAKILERLSFPSPRDLSEPGIKPESPVSLALADRFFTC